MEQNDSINNVVPVSIRMNENGEADGVRVRTLDEDFTIALHDLEGGDGYSFDSAQEKLNELGLDTFNKKQGLIIAAYIEEINAKLTEAGGEPFERDWYTSNELFRPVGVADCTSRGSWYFDGNSGVMYDGYRYYGYFRCRPVLA